MNIIDHRNAVLVIGGETLTTVTGLSDDNPPVELPEIPLYETHVGYDGTMYAQGTGRQGGEVKIKLLPTSPTNVRWLNIHAQIQKGMHVIFRGTYNYQLHAIDGNGRELVQDYGFTLSGGVMKMGPPGIIAGMNGIWTFEFEKITPDVLRSNLDSLHPE